ncbi:TPA_asm: protein 2 [Pinus banksiana virus 1]|uniref:Protein 2 n=1 Tax=Pinus banksiana virus 1 TaxID=2977980 RepID=A0A9N7AAN0_9RHAB|nr:TPA_asm: protein 2 [Pinus banksiana virus 1]
MESAKDAISEVNEQMRMLREGQLEINPGIFEGIELPKSFDESLAAMEIPEGVEEEDDDSEDESELMKHMEGGESSITPQGKGQVSAKDLKEALREERLKSKSHKPSVEETTSKRGKWADEENEDEEDSRKGVLLLKEEGGDLSEKTTGLPMGQLTGSWNDLISTLLPIDQLSQHLTSLGISMNQQEYLDLERKTSAMGGLSAREGVMYFEGLRRANTLSEAKVSGSLDVLARTLEKQKAQVRSLEKTVSEIKSAERGYLELIERMKTDKMSLKESLDRQVAIHVEEEKKKLILFREREQEKFLEKLKADRESFLAKLGSNVPKPEKKSKKAGSKDTSEPPSPAVKKGKNIMRSFLEDLDNMSIEEKAGAELTSLATFLETSVSTLVEFFEVSVEAMNEGLTGFPKSVKEWKAEYKTLDGASTAVQHKFISIRD